jgi:hypothetical protein
LKATWEFCSLTSLVPRKYLIVVVVVLLLQRVVVVDTAGHRWQVTMVKHISYRQLLKVKQLGALEEGKSTYSMHRHCNLT